jgi:D-alanyl-D-alanine dipeptidase
MSLVEVSTEKLGAEFDLRYASHNNFTGNRVYKTDKFLLHPEAARRLKQASEIAQSMGYKFKIFDGFRPIEAQAVLYKYAPYPEFVSSPEAGALTHCRGIAVDLTLVEFRSGKELEMGTEFDAFTTASYQGSLGVSQQAQRNRAMLLGIMTLCGFEYLETEWWHFQLPGYSSYKIYDQYFMGLRINDF